MIIVSLLLRSHESTCEKFGFTIVNENLIESSVSLTEAQCTSGRKARASIIITKLFVTIITKLSFLESNDYCSRPMAKIRKIITEEINHCAL